MKKLNLKHPLKLLVTIVLTIVIQSTTVFAENITLPVAQFPKNNIVKVCLNTHPVFAWQGITQNDQYIKDVTYNVYLLSKSIKPWGNMSAEGLNGTGYEWNTTLSPLPNGSYKWFVRAFDKNHNAIGDSKTLSFRVRNYQKICN